MADLDRLLVADISRAAAEAAEPPDFAAIQRRGLQRRRAHAVLVAAAAAVAVAIVAVGTSLVSGIGDTSPSPAPEPSTKDPVNGPVVKAGPAPRRWTHPIMENEAPGSGPLLYSSWQSVDPDSGSFLYGLKGGGVGILDESGPVAKVDCPITPEPGTGRGAGCGDVAFGPDDDELTFIPAQLDESARSLTIVGYDGEVRETVALPDAVPDNELELTTWSPDGRQLAVAMDTPDGGSAAVWIIPRDGDGDEARLAHREEAQVVDGNVHTPVMVDLAWSPDGGRLGILIAHSGADWIETGEPVKPSDPRPRLIIVPAQGGQAQTLHTFHIGSDDREAMMTGNYDNNWAFAWAPDGKHIAVTHEGGIAEISAIDGTMLVEHPGVGDSGPLAWLAK